MTILAAAGVTPTRLAGKGFYYLWRKCRPAVFAVALVVGAVKATMYIRAKNRRKKWNNVGEDVVVLHIFPRGRFCPSLSPFVLKLETYLRMASIPYEVDFEEPMGPKGKCPWITLNGEEIADSQLIIERLGPKFGKDFSSHLTPEQKALGLTLRITVDEHLFWCFGVWRFIVDDGRAFVDSVVAPRLFAWTMPLYKRTGMKRAKCQGIGHHSFQEIEEMGMKELHALSTLLGDKPYFMGEEATEVDCSMFGILAQIQWNCTGSPYLKLFESDVKNLSDYCFRMKEKYWPDWNQCLNPSQPEDSKDTIDNP